MNLRTNIHPWVCVHENYSNRFGIKCHMGYHVIALLGEQFSANKKLITNRAVVVHFNFRAGSTFPVPVCTVPHWLWVNKADNQKD